MAERRGDRRGDRRDDRRRDSRRGRRPYKFSRKKVCAFCAERARYIDYKSVNMLRQYRGHWLITETVVVKTESFE